MKKLLKFDKLFEYYDYLTNIDNMTKVDIKSMSDMLNSYVISEGLIKTHPLIKSVEILKRKFNNYEIFGEDNEIYIGGVITDYEDLKNLLNTLGYYLSSVIQRDKIIKIEELNDKEKCVMSFEPKYDMVVSVPEIIFHSTLLKYSDKIKKIGLIPKSKNKISQHPDRIYFSMTFEDAISFTKYLEEEYHEPTVIIVVNTKDIDNVFYSDVNFRKSGIYTMNNISPKNIIKILNKNERNNKYVGRKNS